ncbi:MAG: hypothetical protein QOI56_970, partial [Actinomycetota bacterium]|nr:hypothetical protein [Actinomycetota bacterium]
MKGVRFKVKTDTSDAYDRLVRLLEDREVEVFVRSPKRRFVSTGELPREVLSTIQTFGATVTPEIHHVPEKAPALSRRR